jgi:eukaryotic-like serine/threonine-protein kinase
VTPSGSDESLIARLLALPAAERASALERACAEDPALRGRLAEIEAEIAAAENFQQAASGEGLSPDSLVQAFNLALEAAPAEASGTRIGPYKLLQEIGRGGFGVVWMADQEEPIKRRVALKIIKAGMDTKEVIARFEAERQALALMDHPNIAHVFDAGATDAGRPYFVMELVRGVAITRYCDENRLPVEARLRLFILVCQAVQHAHQKGVIHRDLKPSNILVTLHDGVPVPKVIDFGIAKATRSRLTEKTLFTQFHAFIGTPAYTSPEQMEMSGLDVDTRSDIYSLGVLLYELLTGRPPFDAGELVKSGLEAMRRTIREIDPPRPSHRLTTLAKDDRVTVARQRSTEASRLPVLVYGDLDWIVMRCLEKDRTRRYETATGLARDIQRHLENEPVAARPPSTTYVLRKLIRRNKLVFTAGATIAAALVMGIVASTWEAVRAVRAERTATLERGKAVDERARAEDMLTFMLGDLRTQLAKVGKLKLLESVGDKAMAYFASRDARDLSDAELVRYSKALSQIGKIRMDEMRYSEAEAAFSEAYGRAAALAARHPQDGDMLFERGQAEFGIGDFHRRHGKLAAAAEWFTRYYDTSLALLALDPSRFDWRSELAWGQHNIAFVRKERGEFDGARAGFLSELATLDKLNAQKPGELDTLDRVADAHGWLGIIAEQQGQFPEASRQFSVQEAQLEQLVSRDPGTPDFKEELAGNALMHEALVGMATGELLAAGDRLIRAQKLLDELVALDSSNQYWLSVSLHCRLIEAILARGRGDPAAAARFLDDVRPQIESLMAAEPAERRLVLWLATAWRLDAQLRASSDLAAAATAAARAVELGEKLIREGRATDADLGECAKAGVVAGEISARSGSGAAAQRDWQRAGEILAPRVQGSSDWQLLDPAARAAAWMGRLEEARATISRLTQLGYLPLDPWPDLKRAAAAPEISNPNP